MRQHAGPSSAVCSTTCPSDRPTDLLLSPPFKDCFKKSIASLRRVTSFRTHLNVVTNHVCCIHDYRRRGESFYRRKIGRVQEKRDRVAEQERAIGTRAIWSFFFLCLSCVVRSTRGDDPVYIFSWVSALLGRDSLSRERAVNANGNARRGFA